MPSNERNKKQMLPSPPSSTDGDELIVRSVGEVMGLKGVKALPVPLRVDHVQLANRAVLRANPERIQDVERERKRLEERLEMTRKEYMDYTELFKSEEKMLAYLDAIAKRGMDLKAQLEALPRYPSLRAIGEDALKDLVYLVQWTDSQINTGKSLDMVQVGNIAESIYEMYGHWRIEDVAACLKRNVIQASGPVMRLDTQVIMSWCLKYEEARLAEAERESLDTHKRLA